MRAISIVAALSILLGSATANAQQWDSVRNAPTVAAQTAKFQQLLLSKLGSPSKLSDCKHLIRMSEGRGPSSWGAFCTISTSPKPPLIMLCNDELMGYFAIQAGAFIVDEGELAMFVRNNCYGS